MCALVPQNGVDTSFCMRRPMGDPNLFYKNTRKRILPLDDSYTYSEVYRKRKSVLKPRAYRFSVKRRDFTLIANYTSSGRMLGPDVHMSMYPKSSPELLSVSLP